MSEEVSSRSEELSPVEVRLLELAKTNPDGVSNEDVKEHFKDIPIQEVTVAINQCLELGCQLDSLDISDRKAPIWLPSHTTLLHLMIPDPLTRPYDFDYYNVKIFDLYSVNGTPTEAFVDELRHEFEFIRQKVLGTTPDPPLEVREKFLEYDLLFEKLREEVKREKDAREGRKELGEDIKNKLNLEEKEKDK